MAEITIALLAKLAALALIPLAFALAWTAVQLMRGDRLAYRQAKQFHPRIWDAVRGRTIACPSERHGSPLSDGLLVRERDGRIIWTLNSRMSDEQYDRLTK